jgi:DNA polymerase (family X)
MNRETMADVLDEIALMMELKDENPFKIKAYRGGAEVVRTYADDIVALAAAGNLVGIKGIGEALRDKLHILATTGKLPFHENLRAEFPSTLFDLFDIQGLGAKKIKALFRGSQVASAEDLQKACEQDRVASLAGFGAKTQANLLESLLRLRTYAKQFRLSAVAPIIEDFLDLLREHPETLRVAVCGSYRRSKEVVGDIDLLVATSQPAELTKYVAGFPGIDHVMVHGDTKISVRLSDGPQCDVRAVSNAQFPFALQYFSGSKEHNVAIRQRAQDRGWTLNEYGMVPVDASAAPVPPILEEADIYRALDLDPIEPELRENLGEIEAAERHELPRLIQIENLRGTFHNHTQASDGRHSLAEMKAAAEDLGLAYLGISDHSKSSVQANGLDEIRLLAQIAEIRQVNAADDTFTIFAGSEVDIHKDGSLDFEDEILAQLDYCVASVHTAFTLDEDLMTKRIIRAMENPHVTMLGHLSGRLLLKRDAYAVNHAKIIDAAAETRTIIELNCNPRRLDMDWRWWRRARDKGVLCSINPDAHTTAQLQFLRFGVTVARKGWLRREDVVNTKSREQMAAFLALPKHQR